MTGSNVSATAGSPAVLTCNVSVTPSGTTINYQWKRIDMSAISGVNSSKYVVSESVALSAAGVYTCEVTISDAANSPYVLSGTGSVNITLTVSSK